MKTEETLAEIDKEFSSGKRPVNPNIAYQSESILSSSECKTLRKQLLKCQGREGVVYGNMGGPIVNPSQYRAHEHFFDPRKRKYQWLIDRLMPHVKAAGERFDMDSLRLEEAARMVVYGKGGLFNGHPDSGPLLRRRLTLTLQLSSPSKYKGGRFLVAGEDGEWAASKKAQGTCTIFPAELWHRVMPVLGERYALVMWFY